MQFSRVSLSSLRFLQQARSSVRLSSTAVNNDVKPFSEMPSPKGKLPIFGHLYEMNKRSNVMPSIVFDEFFKELGSIYKIEILGGMYIIVLHVNVANTALSYMYVYRATKCHLTW